MEDAFETPVFVGDIILVARGGSGSPVYLYKAEVIRVTDTRATSRDLKTGREIVCQSTRCYNISAGGGR